MAAETRFPHGNRVSAISNRVVRRLPVRSGHFLRNGPVVWITLRPKHETTRRWSSNALSWRARRGGTRMLDRARVISNILGLIGATAGGVFGHVLFWWIARQGFYALILPGG